MRSEETRTLTGSIRSSNAIHPNGTTSANTVQNRLPEGSFRQELTTESINRLTLSSKFSTATVSCRRPSVRIGKGARGMPRRNPSEGSEYR